MITIGSKPRRKPVLAVRWRHDGDTVTTDDGTRRRIGEMRNERLAKHVARNHNKWLESR